MLSMGARGMMISMVVPAPGSLSMWMRPPERDAKADALPGKRLLAMPGPEPAHHFDCPSVDAGVRRSHSRKLGRGQVKAPPFAYVRARSTAELFDVLDAHGDGARILAGGQSLVASLNLRLSEPRVLVDISHLPGLSDIAAAHGLVTIGALTRHADIARSGVVAAHLPLLAQAVQHVAHPAIRNRGTIGGSLALNDPAAEYPAVALALGATMLVRGRAGIRRVPAAQFFHGIYATALAPDELLEAIEFPAQAPGQRSVFLELARRHGDYAMVGLAAHATVRDGQASALRLVFLAVGDGPTDVPCTAAVACGGLLTQQIASAQATLADELHPSGDLNASPATRLHLARVLLGRALAGLAA